jgi:large subunit ribosomal protein L7/L12
MPDITHQQVVDYLNSLSPSDLGALIQELEVKWGVSSEPLVPVALQAHACDEGHDWGEEYQTEFQAILTDAGPNRITAIKVVRQITSLGLKEAKELVESVPKVIKADVSREEANDIKAAFEEIGAKVIVK